MKILLLNVNAISGSTGKIVTDIKSVLEANGHECLICYGANDNIREKGYRRICSEFERRINAGISRITGILHGKFLPLSFWRFKKIVKEWKPDIVHIHCPNGYIIDVFKTLEFLAKSKIKTVLTNHAEYFYTGGCGYAYDCKKWITGCNSCSRIKGIIGLNASKIEWKEFKRAFNLFDSDKIIVTSVSPWVVNRARQSQALKRFNNEAVLNGVDTDIFRVRKVSQHVKERLPNGKPIILHVTASFSQDKTDIKGGHWIIELAKKMPEIDFVIACTYNHITGNLPKNILIWGKTKTQVELAELYNAADVTVITSKRETFSMVVAESLCCGTPVVGFEAGGPEGIAIPEFSRFVEKRELSALKNAITVMYENNNPDKKLTISSQAHSKYSKRTMSANYIDIYKSLYTHDA